MSLICSVKEYLKYRGELIMIQMFKDWTEDNDEWKKMNEITFEGRVTGTTNVTKKYDFTDCAINRLCDLLFEVILIFDWSPKILAHLFYQLEMNTMETKTYLTTELARIHSTSCPSSDSIGYTNAFI